VIRELGELIRARCELRVFLELLKPMVLDELLKLSHAARLERKLAQSLLEVRVRSTQLLRYLHRVDRALLITSSVGATAGEQQADAATAAAGATAADATAAEATAAAHDHPAEATATAAAAAARAATAAHAGAAGSHHRTL
jgi:hypothetical protein